MSVLEPMYSSCFWTKVVNGEETIEMGSKAKSMKSVLSPNTWCPATGVKLSSAKKAELVRHTHSSVKMNSCQSVKGRDAKIISQTEI